MRDLILGLPEQLRWAARLDVSGVPAADEALVVAMGGSAIGGDVASVIAAEAGRRLSVHRGYGLPGWAARHRPLVVAVSHSGATEETLDAVDAARDAGLDVAAVTTGGVLGDRAAGSGWARVEVPDGPQPRAAMGSLTGAVLRVAEGAGLLPPQADALEEAADVVDRLLGGGDGPGVGLADDLAEALEGRVAVVYGGAGPGAVAARRWKTQINENAKAPAYAGEVPEIDHNEVVGWEAVPGLSLDRIGIVWLRDAGDHPRVDARVRVTAEVIDELVTTAGEVWSTGSGTLARLFSLSVIGDLVSDALAARAGVDPMPVDVITELKERLAREDA
ncbi:MAG: bifunctional phosphoglucose/phosphomannose isomerase [Acidimicrobiia bacterium]|nr:bifunctional phosphoglucose/phosphomannose isomerase [Acidimicrobiia bacterium]